MTKRLKWMLLILLILALALAADRFILQAENSLEPARSPVRSANIDTLPLDAELADKPLLPASTKFNAIWQKNLFAADRKPARQVPSSRRTSTVQSKARVLNDGPPEFTITGVALRPDGGSVLIKKARSEVVRAFVGDEIDGWTIEELSPDSVTLSRNGDRWQLPVGTE